MEVIQYFFVSIFLFIDKTNGEDLTASFLHDSVTSPSFGINSAVNDDISNFFPNSRILTLIRNIDINENKKNLSSTGSDYENSKNRLTVDKVSLYVDIKITDSLNIIDDLTNCTDDNMKNIYNSVVYLFVDKWDQLHTKEKLMTDYPNNLGFEKKTMNLINRSMTELVHLQRRNKITINHLGSAYLYSCDLKNSLVKSTGDDDFKNECIRNKFNNFLSYYTSYYTQLQKETRKSFIESTEENLEKYLNKITEKVKTSFNITVELIKNYAVITETQNPTVEKLQETVIEIDTYKEKLSDYSILNARDNNILNVIVNHLVVNKQIILRMYEFVVNHLELSAELCKHTLDDNDKKTIDGFRTFMHFFMPLFIDRYFELDGSLNLKFIEKILKLLDFVFPESDGNSENKLTILNYTKQNENAEITLNEYILSLSNDTLDALLDFFKVRNKDSWKKEIVDKIKCVKDGEHEKEEIITSMNDNFITAMQALVVFIMDYDVGRKLFEETANNE